MLRFKKKYLKFALYMKIVVEERDTKNEEKKQAYNEPKF